MALVRTFERHHTCSSSERRGLTGGIPRRRFSRALTNPRCMPPCTDPIDGHPKGLSPSAAESRQLLGEGLPSHGFDRLA